MTTPKSPDAGERPAIVAAAIRFRGVTYSVQAPGRHHDCIRLAAEATGAEYIDCREDDQGFVDSTGRYLRRAPALRVALESGQATKECLGFRLGKLFSEDVW
jgi:hypothetical protein